MVLDLLRYHKKGDRWSTYISLHEHGVPKNACHIPKLYSLRPIEDDPLSFLVCPTQDDPLLKIEIHLSLLYSLSLTLLSQPNIQNKTT